jgi:CRP-like cAMP-binding protein
MTYSDKKISGTHASREVLAFLSNSGWLAKRPAKSKKLILACGRMRHYQAGETIYRIGDPPQGMYGLVKGGIIVSIPNDAGSDFAVYQSSNGFWIGDLAIFASQIRLVTVVAAEDTDVLFLPQPKIEALVKDHPALIEDFYALSHLNMAIALRLLANMAIPDTKKRLAAWLLFSDDGLEHSGDWISVPQERLAAMIAVSMPTAQRLLKQLVALDLVETGYGRIRVRDRSALVRYLET